VLLLLDAFLTQERRGITHWLSVGILLVTGVLVLMGQDIRPDALTAFNGMLVSTTAWPRIKGFHSRRDHRGVSVFARRYLGRTQAVQRRFYTLCSFAALSAMLLVSAGNLADGVSRTGAAGVVVLRWSD
jgi:NADH-quinone oxidoreductase subunit N